MSVDLNSRMINVRYIPGVSTFIRSYLINFRHVAFHFSVTIRSTCTDIQVDESRRSFRIDDDTVYGVFARDVGRAAFPICLEAFIVRSKISDIWIREVGRINLSSITTSNRT